jgi:hypothetical protein
MNKRRWWSPILCVVGLVVTIVPVGLVYRALTVYESQSAGFPGVLVDTALILPTIGSGLVAFGAFLGKNPYRRFMYCAFGLTLCSTIGLVLVLSSEAPGALWYTYVPYAYLIGVIMSFVGAVAVTVESFG